MVRSGNLFADSRRASDAELTTILADRPGARVERIVSTGQASPAGFWYDQDWAEWVIVFGRRGRAADRGRREAEEFCSRATMSSFRRMSATGSNGPIRTGRPFGSRFTGREGPASAVTLTLRSLRPGGKPGPRARSFPANRVKCRYFLPFWPIFGKAVLKSPTIRAGSTKIPYAVEQGINSDEQGIKVPCSAENRDAARLILRLFDVFRPENQKN